MTYYFNANLHLNAARKQQSLLLESFYSPLNFLYKYSETSAIRKWSVRISCCIWTVRPIPHSTLVLYYIHSTIQNPAVSGHIASVPNFPDS